jgi:DNA-binding response OmpR family regulator
MRVIIVEDADSAGFLATILKQWGHQVTTATAVADALILCAENEFDLLISDLVLPDANGCELIQMVRGKCKIKSIAVSECNSQHDINASCEAGFDAYLSRPVNLALLDKTIASLMRA